MQLGISSYTYNWWAGVAGYMPPQPLTAATLLARAASRRISLVQIADNLPLESLSEAELDALAGQARALAIEIETGTRGVTEAIFEKHLSIAQRLGSRFIRTLLDSPGDQPAESEAVARLRAAVPACDRAGVTIGIENHDRVPSATLRRIIDRVASPFVGICLDTANSLGCGEGLSTVLDSLAEVTVNLHIKDFNVRRLPHSKGFIVEGAPAGQGLVDIPALLQRLKDAGRDVNCILELWSSPESTVQESIRKEDVWADESLDYLKRLIPARNGTDVSAAP